LPRQAANSFAVSATPITGISFVGVFGCRTRSIGDRSMACSSTSSHLKKLLQLLVFVQRRRRGPRVDHPRLERLHMPPRDRARIIRGGVSVRIRGVLGQEPAQLRRGQQIAAC